MTHSTSQYPTLSLTHTNSKYPHARSFFLLTFFFLRTLVDEVVREFLIRCSLMYDLLEFSGFFFIHNWQVVWSGWLIYTITWFLWYIGTPVYLVFLTPLYCLVGCLSMAVWIHMLFWVSSMYVIYILVFVHVQRNWACFTWKGALETLSLLSLS